MYWYPLMLSTLVCLRNVAHAQWKRVNAADRDREFQFCTIWVCSKLGQLLPF